MVEETKSDGVVKEVKYASWDDLAQPAELKTMVINDKGMCVRYRPFMSTKELVRAQTKHKDKPLAVIGAILKAVMVDPPIRNEADARKAMNASSRLLSIVSEVMSPKDFEDLKDELGEDL